jgi:hypothetical protein
VPAHSTGQNRKVVAARESQTPPDSIIGRSP